jgi:hypothetical protein
MPRPTFLEVIGPIFAQFPREQQPLFAAAAERLAAQRYRQWAQEVGNETARDDLLACAGREEEIADRVDKTHDSPTLVHEQLAREHPDLRERYWSIFDGLSRAEQFAEQAAAERLGAETWRGFAAECTSSPQESVYLACALLEEESATVLERLVADGLDA